MAVVMAAVAWHVDRHGQVVGLVSLMVGIVVMRVMSVMMAVPSVSSGSQDDYVTTAYRKTRFSSPASG